MRSHFACNFNFHLFVRLWLFLSVTVPSRYFKESRPDNGRRGVASILPFNRIVKTKDLGDEPSFAVALSLLESKRAACAQA
ncbi:hypothetical protein EVAR_81333_1 [Eumeta japonica]|uniref:Secreted protein n=1 Tax=Eumeta variegata TaxID=151549 RepID=A0A4C1W2S2_EUMVA|nr:hypothetical protein EVAR_81333_1 [Eumeta japonica]